MKKVLVTGGTGYIGSHTVVELLNSGKDVVIVDNCSNSKPEVLDRIKEITGKDVKFYKIDYLNKQELEKVFEENEIDSVINFAGYKAVGESVKEPLKYYHNNVSGAIVLLETMQKYNVKKFIFSSSATVYGDQGNGRCAETMKRGKTTNPYGTTKSIIEKILEDLYVSDNSWNIASDASRPRSWSRWRSGWRGAGSA
ncbi:MAG: SDR family NAD(P)-dependent oxidoreductase, partial [Bacteroidetes bacterium]|nr:SDR family NAD(P)-dependent oxidoreductase [Bacteroidota bacterium]